MAAASSCSAVQRVGGSPSPKRHRHEARAVTGLATTPVVRRTDAFTSAIRAHRADWRHWPRSAACTRWGLCACPNRFLRPHVMASAMMPEASVAGLCSSNARLTSLAYLCCRLLWPMRGGGVDVVSCVSKHCSNFVAYSCRCHKAFGAECRRDGADCSVASRSAVAAEEQHTASCCPGDRLALGVDLHWFEVQRSIGEVLVNRYLDRG